MDVRRRLALGIATLGIAIGAGHLVQDGRSQTSAQDPESSAAPDRPSGIVVLSASGIPAGDQTATH
jgi:hypothetical protein